MVMVFGTQVPREFVVSRITGWSEKFQERENNREHETFAILLIEDGILLDHTSTRFYLLEFRWFKFYFIPTLASNFMSNSNLCYRKTGMSYS